jgi:hypothetical protein
MKIAALVAAAFLTIPTGLLRADAIAYMAAGNANFGTLDLTTGVYTQIGGTGAQLVGLGEIGDGLYGGISLSDGVDEVNTATGALTPLTTSGANPSGGWRDFGSTTTGMYGIDNAGELYSVTSAGVITAIGATGLNSTTDNWADAYGMSADARLLYFTNNSSIYTINTTNGNVSLLNGSDGASPGIGALVSVGGTLYGGQGLSPDWSVATVNTTTGAATDGPAVTGNPGGFYGLADVQSAPEPASAALFLCGGAAILVLRRRGRSNPR